MQAPFMDLANKVVLITGASSGIGEAAAYAFAALGCKLVLGARRQSEGEAVAAKIRAEGGEAIFVQTDVLQESDIARLVATAVQSFGRLDVAFNNAGTEGEFSPLIEQSRRHTTLGGGRLPSRIRMRGKGGQQNSAGKNQSGSMHRTQSFNADRQTDHWNLFSWSS